MGHQELLSWSSNSKEPCCEQCVKSLMQGESNRSERRWGSGRWGEWGQSQRQPRRLCSVYCCCLRYGLLHSKLMWRGTELDESVLFVFTECSCWLLLIGSPLENLWCLEFFFFNFTLPLKHRSAFSSFCILVTKEMNVIRNADLHSKWSGTVWAFYVFGSSSTSCFLEHRI